MGQLTFLVNVETERESGKFAGRDEISEAISNAIQDAESNAELSSLGADGDSVYNITSFEIEELEKKDRKAVYDEYHALVVEQLPGDAELRQQVKDLKAEIKKLNAKIETEQNKVTALVAERTNDQTRIWQADERGLSALDDDSPKTYLKDGKYDFVNFQWGDNWDEKLTAQMDSHGSLIIRADGWGRGRMVVVPNSSNEVQISMMEVPRDGR